VTDEVFGVEPSLVSGPPWFQGDHAVFAMHGVPALAITSERAGDLMATVIHTPADTIDLVDPSGLVRLARAVHRLIERLGAAV
jgi:aminopeptidase YwaD